MPPVPLSVEPTTTSSNRFSGATRLRFCLLSPCRRRRLRPCVMRGTTRLTDTPHGFDRFLFVLLDTRYTHLSMWPLNKIRDITRYSSHTRLNPFDFGNRFSFESFLMLFPLVHLLFRLHFLPGITRESHRTIRNSRMWGSS